jgi:hypothetical protein
VKGHNTDNIVGERAGLSPSATSRSSANTHFPSHLLIFPPYFALSFSHYTMSLPPFKCKSSLRTPGFNPAKRKTHKNSKVAKLFKDMPIDRRLRINKEINEKNKKKREAKLKKATGDQADDVSSIASFIIISNDSYEEFRKIPELFERLKSLMPFRVLGYMTKRNAEEKAARNREFLLGNTCSDCESSPGRSSQ